MSVDHALHPRDPELIRLVRRAGENARRAGCLAYKQANQAHRVSHPLIWKAQELCFRHGSVDDGTIIPELQVLADQIEQLYWDRGSDEQDADARASFAKARVVNSLACCLIADPEDAALGAIYEAYASFDTDEQRQALLVDMKWWLGFLGSEVMKRV